MKRALAAEFIGTFGLVFFGPGAIVINDMFGGAIGHIGIAVAFGIVVTAMIFAFGPISGAHINPAVTLAFAVTPMFEKKKILPYVIAQILGAILAASFLYMLFPTHETMGSTIPAIPIGHTFIVEVVITFFLMAVILFMSQNNELQHLTAVGVGAYVGLAALVAGPLCGASMNPARSIGPAIISGQIGHLWLFILAPCIGALLASAFWYLMRTPEHEIHDANHIPDVE